MTENDADTHKRPINGERRKEQSISVSAEYFSSFDFALLNLASFLSLSIQVRHLTKEGNLYSSMNMGVARSHTPRRVVRTNERKFGPDFTSWPFYIYLRVLSSLFRVRLTESRQACRVSEFATGHGFRNSICMHNFVSWRTLCNSTIGLKSALSLST